MSRPFARFTACLVAVLSIVAFSENSAEAGHRKKGKSECSAPATCAPATECCSDAPATCAGVPGCTEPAPGATDEAPLPEPAPGVSEAPAPAPTYPTGSAKPEKKRRTGPIRRLLSRR